MRGCLESGGGVRVGGEARHRIGERARHTLPYSAIVRRQRNPRTLPFHNYFLFIFLNITHYCEANYSDFVLISGLCINGQYEHKRVKD